MSNTPTPWNVPLKQGSGGRPLVSIDKAEVLAPYHALDRFGQQMQAVGREWYDDNQNEAVADAKLQATKDMMELEKTLRENPNYKQHVATFTEAAKEIRERNASAITHPLKRAAFVRELELHALQRADAIDKQARATDISHSRAALDRQLEEARVMLSDSGVGGGALLDPEQREKLTLDTGKAIANLAARPGYLDPQKAGDLYHSFRENVASDAVMRAARAGDLEAARALLADGAQYIPEHKRWSLEDHMQTVATRQAKIASADIDQRREAALDEIERTGATLNHPPYAELIKWKGGDAAAEYAADMAVATQKHAARSQFVSMTDADIDKWVESRKPEEGMEKGTKEGELYTWAKGFASRTKAARSADVAKAFDGVDYVQEARKTGKPIDVMRARLKAQTVAGLPEDNQSPITRADAAQLMAEVKDAPNKPQAFKALVSRLESQYGADMATRIMRSAVRLEYQHDQAGADLTGTAVNEIMRLGQVTPNTAQRVKTHGDILAAESVYARTASDYERMPPDAAEKLRADPKLADSFIKVYGAKQVHEALTYKGPGQRLREGASDVLSTVRERLNDRSGDIEIGNPVGGVIEGARRSLSESWGPVIERGREHMQSANEPSHAARKIAPNDARALLSGKMSDGQFDRLYGKGRANDVRQIDGRK